MGDLICKAVAVGEILGIDVTDRPFLHEQGQVVLRGYVQSLEISDTQWTLHMRDVEILDKASGTWSLDAPVETHHGPMNRTTFHCCRDEQHPMPEPAIQISCYGMLTHIGLRLGDPWRDNHWPELDTEFLPADMRSGGTSS